MAYTRKQKSRRGGAWWNRFTRSSTIPRSDAENTAKAILYREQRKGHSRISNLQRTIAAKGEYVPSLNSQLAQAKFDETMKLIKQREGRYQPVSALRDMLARLQDGLQKASTSDTTRKVEAITLTIPVGIAQVIVKALMIVIAFLVFVFVELPSMGSIPASAYLLPNTGFETTEQAYEKMKQITGARKIAEERN
jgi:hypothetical protein